MWKYPNLHKLCGSTDIYRKYVEVPKFTQTVWRYRHLYKICGSTQIYTNRVAVPTFIQNMWKYPNLHKPCGGTDIYKKYGRVPDACRRCGSTQITVSSRNIKPNFSHQLFPTLTTHIISETISLAESKLDILVVKTDEMHKCTIYLIKHSTCFGQFHCPTSAVSQHCTHAVSSRGGSVGVC